MIFDADDVHPNARCVSIGPERIVSDDEMGKKRKVQ
jgi:hypothetical protein